jgi:hypothetical protein
MPKAFGFLGLAGVVCTSAATASAQTVICRVQPAPQGLLTGRCVQGDTVVGELAFQRPAAAVPHLWLGTIRGARFRSAASSGPAGESQLAVDVRPDGALQLGRAWLALRNVSTDSGGLRFSFRFDRPQRATGVDLRILERARATLSEASRWNRADTTDMQAAPTKGFGCAPSRRQSMFCAIYLASVEIAGDYAHFRPAVNAVRQAVPRGREYRHPLIDFNNDSSTTLTRVHALLDGAAAALRRELLDCNRQCLAGLADDYLDALVTHAPARVVAEQVKFTENGAALRLGQGLWQTARDLGRYRVYVIDPDSSSVAVQTVLSDSAADVQLLVRLKAPAGRITEIETLIARDRETCCWDLARLDSLSPVFAESLPAAEPVTRQDLVVLADEYFTALHTSGTPEYRRARMQRGMNRYENGLLTTNVPGGGRLLGADAMAQFDSAMFGPIRVVHRRYPVVDRENGTLLAIVVFESPNPRGQPTIISEFFKIVKQEIHEIRAVMVRGGTTGWQ